MNKTELQEAYNNIKLKRENVNFSRSISTIGHLSFLFRDFCHDTIPIGIDARIVLTGAKTVVINRHGEVIDEEETGQIIKHFSHASLLQRIKWVFTGIKYKQKNQA